MKMKRSAFSDTLNIMRGRARIIKEEEIYIERFKTNFTDIMILQCPNHMNLQYMYPGCSFTL